jgi:ferredoxin
MKKYKFFVDQNTCIGCAACHAMCPKYFEMKDTSEGDKAQETQGETEEFDPVMEAAEVCPVNAIHIDDENGKRLI